MADPERNRGNKRAKTDAENDVTGGAGPGFIDISGPITTRNRPVATQSSSASSDSTAAVSAVSSNGVETSTDDKNAIGASLHAAANELYISTQPLSVALVGYNKDPSGKWVREAIPGHLWEYNSSNPGKEFKYILEHGTENQNQIIYKMEGRDGQEGAIGYRFPMGAEGTQYLVVTLRGKVSDVYPGGGFTVMRDMPTISGESAMHQQYLDELLQKFAAFNLPENCQPEFYHKTSVFKTTKARFLVTDLTGDRPDTGILLKNPTETSLWLTPGDSIVLQAMITSTFAMSGKVKFSHKPLAVIITAKSKSVTFGQGYTKQAALNMCTGAFGDSLKALLGE